MRKEFTYKYDGELRIACLSHDCAGAWVSVGTVVWEQLRLFV